MNTQERNNMTARVGAAMGYSFAVLLMTITAAVIVGIFLVCEPEKPQVVIHDVQPHTHVEEEGREV